jgi:CRP/FNR family transcriptional regulator
MKKLSGNISVALLKELETRGRRKVYGEGEEIFAEGEPAEFLPIVISGAVKMIRSPVAGKEMIIGIFREGEMFAVPPVVDGAPYPSSAVAIDETTLLQLPRAEFLRLLNEKPELALATIAWMSEMLREKTATIRNLAIASPEHRIGNVLMKLAKEQKGGTPIKIPVRRQDIAEMASLTTETTIRAIRRMADQGLVRIVRGKIILDELDSLRDYLRS